MRGFCKALRSPRLLSLLVAVAVCYSRIYLACHFPQDILLGGLVGVVSAILGLLFTESDLLKDFGWFASFAMIGTTLYALIFLPHFFKSTHNRRSDKAFKFLDKINSYPLDEKRWMRVAIEVVCVVCFSTRKNNCRGNNCLFLFDG